MEFIAHRVNTIAELNKLPVHYGVEIDLRDSGDKLILQHEPFMEGEDFEEYLKYYQHGTMILNIKSERIEPKVLELLETYQIKDYFFLDSSFPMIHLLAKKGEGNIAIRFSEYERLDTVLAMKGKVKWVWVDCFNKLPLTKEDFNTLKNAGFQLCLVSPELQGRPGDIEIYRRDMMKNNLLVDAICTKSRNINTWI